MAKEMRSEVSDVKPAAEELADILMVLQRCFLMNLCKELNRGQVSFAQFFLLGYLDHKGKFSMSQIAETMGHTTAAATGLVDRLERLGYVARSHDKDDRRKVMVKITSRGAALVEKIRRELVGNLSEVMERLDEDECEYWLRIYRKIYNFCKGE